MELDEYDPLDEDAPPARDGKGRFCKGSSGNVRGKKFEIKRDPKLPANRRRVVTAVADEIVELKVNGKAVKISMFEANVRALAHAGIKDRVAAQRFIDLVTETSETDLERRLITHNMREYYDHLEEENELLKKKYAPQGHVVHLGLEEFEKWQAQRRLDDDEGVSAALSRDPPNR
jgi:hypothetical protein